MSDFQTKTTAGRKPFLKILLRSIMCWIIFFIPNLLNTVAEIQNPDYRVQIKPLVEYHNFVSFGQNIPQGGLEHKLLHNSSLSMFYKGIPSVEEKIPRRIYWVEVTAYSSTTDQCDDSPFITASNKRVYDGLIAVNFLPFGTKVKLPDCFADKEFTVDDRMHPRFSNRVDVWMRTRQQAKEFGVRHLKMEVY